MKELFAYPPNFRQINAAFSVTGRNVIYAWGKVLYNPTRVKVEPALWKHEEVHGRRQLDFGIELWWAKYIASAAFRFEEEKLAHMAEWEHHRDHLSGKRAEMMKKSIATRLSGPLYNHIVTFEQAMEALG